MNLINQRYYFKTNLKKNMKIKIKFKKIIYHKIRIK